MASKTSVPKWISRIKRRGKRRKWKRYWLKPWTVPPGSHRASGYKRALRKRGRYTTNFTIAETKSKPDNCGCPSTASPYHGRTQKLLFKVERVRHAIGDKAIGNWSIYRNPCHEGCIGGANGYHPRGQAIDPKRPSSVSIGAWNAAWHHEFGRGGIGSQSGSGEVRHADTGPTRRWWY